MAIYLHIDQNRMEVFVDIYGFIFGHRCILFCYNANLRISKSNSRNNGGHYDCSSFRCIFSISHYLQYQPGTVKYIRFGYTNIMSTPGTYQIVFICCKENIFFFKLLIKKRMQEDLCDKKFLILLY